MTFCYSILLFLLVLICVLAQEQSTPTNTENITPKCGTGENDYAPCVAKERADKLFKDCCIQYAPEGCQNLCQYETDELKGRNLVNKHIKEFLLIKYFLIDLTFCKYLNIINLFIQLLKFDCLRGTT